MYRDIREQFWFLSWDLKADTITFNFDKWVNELFSLPLIKRFISKTNAKLFDVLKFTSPITSQFKMVFQIIYIKYLIETILYQTVY